MGTFHSLCLSNSPTISKLPTEAMRVLLALVVLVTAVAAVSIQLDDKKLEADLQRTDVENTVNSDQEEAVNQPTLLSRLRRRASRCIATCRQYNDLSSCTGKICPGKCKNTKNRNKASSRNRSGSRTQSLGRKMSRIFGGK